MQSALGDEMPALRVTLARFRTRQQARPRAPAWRAWDTSQSVSLTPHYVRIEPEVLVGLRCEDGMAVGPCPSSPRFACSARTCVSIASVLVLSAPQASCRAPSGPSGPAARYRFWNWFPVAEVAEVQALHADRLDRVRPGPRSLSLSIVRRRFVLPTQDENGDVVSRVLATDQGSHHRDADILRRPG